MRLSTAIYTPPGHRAKPNHDLFIFASDIGEQSIAIGVSVCLSIREHIYRTQVQTSPNVLCTLPIVVARSSYGGVAIYYIGLTSGLRMICI